jgi:hypothetical protein
MVMSKDQLFQDDENTKIKREIEKQHGKRFRLLLQPVDHFHGSKLISALDFASSMICQKANQVP